MHMQVICNTCTVVPLIRTPLLPKNSVLIRVVSFVEREHHMHSKYLLPKVCVFYREVSFLEIVL